MSLLQQGFREIARKFRRLALSRRIKAAGRVRADALRALGKRAVETGITGPASEGLMAGLAETEVRDRQLASRLASLSDQTKTLEQKRDADTARFDALDKEVMTRKSPVDAELAAQQKTATRNQRETDEVRRRLAQGHQERQSLELALRRPPTEGGAGFDRPKAEAQLAVLLVEQQSLEASQAQLAEASGAAAREIERLKVAIAPLQAELDRIGAERKQATDSVKRALADLRKQADQVKSEAVGVSRQRDMHFEELGGVLASAKTEAPALATEKRAVEAAEQSQATLQNQYDGLLADSRAMPRGTMAKFSALMATAVLAIGGAAYAATQATKAKQPQRQARPAVEDCSRMTYDDNRPPVVADPGGPYTVVRGGKATLDGSKSKGRCLQYTWTFSPAPKDPADSPGHGTADNPEDAAIFEAVDKFACPEGTSGNPGASKRGVRAPTNFLCSLKVTLTVTDGNSSDSKDVVVKVKPRGPAGWKTSVDTNQAETFSADLTLLSGNLAFGKNTCALDTTGGHVLHAGRSWQGEGYKLTSVDDSRGPFDQWWYIDSSSLKIKRVALVSQDLAENSALYKVNIARGLRDIGILQKCVFEHERLHGTIIFEKMQKIQQQGNDPARIIETLSVKNEDKAKLVEWTDNAIGQIDSRLDPDDHNHGELKQRLSQNAQCNRGGRLLVRDGGGGYESRSIENFATTGD